MFSIRFIRILVIGCFALGSVATPSGANAVICSRCTNYKFPVVKNKNGVIDHIRPIIVIREKAPIFPDSVTSTPTGEKTFGSYVYVVKADANRIHVREGSTKEPIGWIERSDLLCSLRPVIGESGLEQKFFIKTATDVRRDKPATVKAYSSPELDSTPRRELSRFDSYFVIDCDENNNSYLLSDSYMLRDGNLPVGWVSVPDGFIWDTAFAARPAENIVFPEGHTKAGEERAVWAYATEDDALNKTNPMAILGGKRWFKIAQRLPIIGRTEIGNEQYYKVMLPIPGLPGRVHQEDTISIVDPEALQANMGIDSVSEMKHIDIMFLIDGTRSMEQHIESIRGSRDNKQKPGVVQQVIQKLKELPESNQIQLRFGFRIYRDQYAGEKELGEGFPLSGECESDRDFIQDNLPEFNDKIHDVNVTLVDWSAQDDYEENLFGGILKAIEDLSTCPTNLKILFVIGDNGYSTAAQARRGRVPINIQQIAEKLKGSKENKERNIVTFFIQTPNDRENARNQDLYDNAYALFNEQAQTILMKILQQADQENLFLLEADDTEISQKIVNRISAFVQPKAINEIVLDLKGGAALVEAIESIQGREEFRNIPGLFWDLVRQGSAKSLGAQYENRIYEAVIPAFLPITDDIVEDVWLTSENLYDWILIARGLGNQTKLKGSELREALGYAIKDTLEKVIREPLIEHTNEPLSIYLQRIGNLPVSDSSKLFHYSLDDLNDRNRVPDCEILRLSVWMHSVQKFLRIVERGDLRPKFTIGNFPTGCPSGHKIPYIDGDILSEPIGKSDKMRFNHQFRDINAYWLPKAYLP